MKYKIFAVILLFTGSFGFTFGQVTEGEKNLRTLSADSTEGWKKGGVFAVNVAQTSLTNWAAGGAKFTFITDQVLFDAGAVGSKIKFKENLGVGFSYKF